jgi:hypothetical protein
LEDDPPRVVRECGYCGAIYRDPLGSLQKSAQQTREAPEPAVLRWLREMDRAGRAVDTVPPSMGLELGDLGCLIVTGDRASDLWRGAWVPGSAAKRQRVQHLTASSVSGAQMRALCDDVARHGDRTTWTDAVRDRLLELAVARGLVQRGTTAQSRGASAAQMAAIGASARKLGIDLRSDVATLRRRVTWAPREHMTCEAWLATISEAQAGAVVAILRDAVEAATAGRSTYIPHDTGRRPSWAGGYSRWGR